MEFNRQTFCVILQTCLCLPSINFEKGVYDTRHLDSKTLDVNTSRRVAQFVTITFDNVIFTDENRFQFYRYTRNRWDKYGHCQKMVPKFSPTVTVWGRISKLGLSPLVLVNWNISCQVLWTFWRTFKFSHYPRIATYTRDWFPAASRDRATMASCFTQLKPYRNCLADHERPCWKLSAQTNRWLENNNRGNMDESGDNWRNLLLNLLYNL